MRYLRMVRSQRVTPAPNPGSEEAVKKGCTCPVIDNARGKGFPWPDAEGNLATSFWITSGCPLHAPKA